MRNNLNQDVQPVMRSVHKLINIRYSQLSAMNTKMKSHYSVFVVKSLYANGRNALLLSPTGDCANRCTRTYSVVLMLYWFRYLSHILEMLNVFHLTNLLFRKSDRSAQDLVNFPSPSKGKNQNVSLVIWYVRVFWNQSNTVISMYTPLFLLIEILLHPKITLSLIPVPDTWEHSGRLFTAEA